MQQLSRYTTPSVNYRCAGELIKFTRKKMGLSQKYVAEKVRMSQSALSKIEAGVNDMPRKILEISNILKLDHNTVMSISLNKKEYNNINEGNLDFENIKSILPNWKDILIKAIQKA